MSDEILVFHPMQQHSHQLAWALYDRGLLRTYYSGVPVLAPEEESSNWMPLRLSQRLKRTAIPESFRVNPWIFPILVKAAMRWSPCSSKEDNVHRVFHAFDQWASRRVLRIRPSVVVGYENSSYYTFQAAKAVGARCVLDLPSISHRAAQKILGDAQTPYTRQINARKDGEIESADLLITCSELAANTYRVDGVRDDKIYSLVLGADPPVHSRLERGDDQVIRFIFAGTVSRRKSFDLILAALDKINQGGTIATLEVIGGIQDNSFASEMGQRSYVCYRGSLPQPELKARLAAADCLLLPSRFDAFGMVVVEALACGTPVVVSTMTGASEILTNYPLAGWVVDADRGQLHELIYRLCAEPRVLAAARKEALLAAQSYSWAAYRGRAGELIVGWLESERQRAPLR